jgi:hypothetical protein
VTPHPVWTVRVLFPRRFRERKHSVGHYRVGAATKEDAVKKVRVEILHDLYAGRPDLRIISCAQTGMSDGVVNTGFSTMDLDDANRQPTL